MPVISSKFVGNGGAVPVPVGVSEVVGVSVVGGVVVVVGGVVVVVTGGVQVIVNGVRVSMLSELSCASIVKESEPVVTSEMTPE
jgi:hypothetical protein